MQLWFRSKIRHPFYPGLHPTPAVEARSRVVALCGAYRELVQAAAAGAAAQRALFVLCGMNQTLTEAERDRLWALFQVPAYALLLDGGRVVGFECEAQNGFHVPGDHSAESTHCECGRPGRMLATRVTENTPSRTLPAPVDECPIRPRP